MMFDNMASALPQIKAGAEGVRRHYPKRSALAPELPTMAEVGLKDFDVFTWWVCSPRWHRTGNREATVRRDRQGAGGARPAGQVVGERCRTAASTPEEFRTFIGKELPKYARIVKESGAKVD